jgi:3-deoxy-D-manno-oct-2-ulosonic acid (Kdo) hydroxylase
MSIHDFPIERWDPEPSGQHRDQLIEALEGGGVLHFPRLAFRIESDESSIFTPLILGNAKNASFEPRSGTLGGTTLRDGDVGALRGLMHRFSRSAATLVARLLPAYDHTLQQARASFRPAEIAGRSTSWRKDDTRLHVDSFPATPTGGRRILRLFSNVNPARRARVWRIGGPFETVARRFETRLRVPWPGSGQLLAVLKITKSRRTPYDALMLQLHDAMKSDEEFQRESQQTSCDFAAGSTWLCFTDEVSHAATSGQYQLEQTFLLPVGSMRQPERSPLRILEQLKRRTLT